MSIMFEFNDPKTTISTDDFNTLAICAFRYALGRRTYITSDVAGILGAYINHLDERTLTVILTDYERAYESEKLGIEHAFGDKCDRDTWVKLEQRLKDQLQAIKTAKEQK